MSYDISWHRRKETIYNPDINDYEVSPYYDDNYNIEEAKELHSGICGYLETYRKPFEVESTGLNITSNLYKMFSWAINGSPELDWKKTIHSTKGSNVESYLRKAVKKMEENEKEARKYDSPNGWGTYPHALRFLKDLLAESIVYKDFYLSINY